MNLWDERLENYTFDSDLSKYIQGKLDRNIKNIITKHLIIDKSMRVLDAGCGKGRWSLWFSTKANSVIAIDKADKPLGYGKRCADVLGINNIEFINANLLEIPLNNKSVDLTFVCITLQHITNKEEFKQVIKEIMRVTHGYIIVLETLKKQIDTREGYISCRTREEYINAFESEGANLLKVIGVRCPYLYYGYLTLLKKLFRTGSDYKDVRDREILWKSINNSKKYGLIKAGFKAILFCSKPFDVLSKRFMSLSTEGVLIFRT